MHFRNIFYFPCIIADYHHVLISVLISENGGDQRKYIGKETAFRL